MEEGPLGSKVDDYLQPEVLRRSDVQDHSVTVRQSETSTVLDRPKAEDYLPYEGKGNRTGRK